MPKSRKEDLLRTLQRSPAKAQRTWAKAHDSAVATYGEGERAHRTAFAALKHSFEKVGDRWLPKERSGPSDPGALRRGGKTYGGVDVLGSTREELYRRARALGVRGASRMRKNELAEAIARKQ
ncbi:MAG TPA: ChaB family protein [Gaiellaceae bacterium]|nr:ChaB family protein [Gaiellaceae bacterium]